MLIGIVCSIPISKLITPSKAINNIVVKYNSSLNFVFIINLIALFTLFTLCIMEISKNSYNPFIYFEILMKRTVINIALTVLVFGLVSYAF